MAISSFSFSRAGIRAIIFSAAVTLVFAAPTPLRAQHMQPTPVMNAYFNMLFAGDLSGAPDLFDEMESDPMTAMMQSRYQARFVDKTSSLDLSALEDPAVRSIAERYQLYWREALTGVDTKDALERALLADVDTHLIADGFDSAGDDEDLLQKNLEAFLETKGVFAQAGKTAPLQDLMLWLDNEQSVETVELTDGTYEIPLNQLSNFVSYGWMNFGSFGMTSAGGWAETDGLYCICVAYDLSSERFKLSFLKHEGRHHIDLQRYPELKAADLEYRAKLTELAFAENEMDRLLAHFTDGANRIENAPHPLANWYVVNGLAEKLTGSPAPESGIDWSGFDKVEIQKAARTLLKEHTHAIEKEGAATTEGLLTV